MLIPSQECGEFTNWSICLIWSIFIKSNGTEARCSRFISRADGTLRVVATISLDSSTKYWLFGGDTITYNGIIQLLRYWVANNGVKGSHNHKDWVIHQIRGVWWPYLPPLRDLALLTHLQNMRSLVPVKDLALSDFPVNWGQSQQWSKEQLNNSW